MNRIVSIAGRLTIALGAFVALAPVASKLFNITWN
jgi:hypothetical protein